MHAALMCAHFLADLNIVMCLGNRLMILDLVHSTSVKYPQAQVLKPALDAIGHGNGC